MPRNEKPDEVPAARARLTDEYRNLSEEEINLLRRHRDTMGISAEFVRPHFDKIRRMWEMYYGIIPEELEGTFSKVMLRNAVAIVQNELPRTAASLLGGEDFFHLEANEDYMELSAEQATQWLNFQLRKKNRIAHRILPTYTRAHVSGMGWRVVTRTSYTEQRVSDETGRAREAQQLGIVSQNVDEFSMLPSPNGTVVNTLDGDNVEALEWLHWIDWKSKRNLEKMGSKTGMNKSELGRMFDAPVSSEGPADRIDLEYKDAILSALNFNTPNWIEGIRVGQDKVEKRYRTVWSFYRDKWILVGENKYLLYAGPPLIDWIPAAAYSDTLDPNSIYGMGLIELCEDIILAYLLCYNLRLDYLAKAMHPTKYMRDDMVALHGGDIDDFDDAPYKVIQFSQKIRDIRQALYVDRMGDVPAQAFMEETDFRSLLQEILGQPNYQKGMGGVGTLANETASGILALIQEGTARSTMRTMNIEEGGLYDEMMLYLKWGKRYVYEDQKVRLPERVGHKWVGIPYEAITDEYGIELEGARGVMHRNQMVERMVSLLPVLHEILGQPMNSGQRVLLEQVLKNQGGFTNIERMLTPAEPVAGLLGAAEGAAARPLGGQPTPEGRGASVAAAAPQARRQLAGASSTAALGV